MESCREDNRRAPATGRRSLKPETYWKVDRGIDRSDPTDPTDRTDMAERMGNIAPSWRNVPGERIDRREHSLRLIFSRGGMCRYPPAAAEDSGVAGAGVD